MVPGPPGGDALRTLSRNPTLFRSQLSAMPYLVYCLWTFARKSNAKMLMLWLLQINPNLPDPSPSYFPLRRRVKTDHQSNSKSFQWLCWLLNCDHAMWIFSYQSHEAEASWSLVRAMRPLMSCHDCNHRCFPNFSRVLFFRPDFSLATWIRKLDVAQAGKIRALSSKSTPSKWLSSGQ